MRGSHPFKRGGAAGRQSAYDEPVPIRSIGGENN
jgi:hypothetical protein